MINKEYRNNTQIKSGNRLSVQLSFMLNRFRAVLHFLVKNGPSYVPVHVSQLNSPQQVIKVSLKTIHIISVHV